MQLFLKEPAKIIWDADAHPPTEREPYVPEKPSLIYLICFDAPNSESNRYLAKMLVSSLLRTFFTGEIIVFRNSPQPLFFVERKGLEEVYLDSTQLAGKAGAEDAWCWKYRVAEMLDVSGYDKVLFLDADFLAIQNIDHLLEGDWDIRYQPERHHPLTEKSYRAYFTPEELENYAKQSQGFPITQWSEPSGYEYLRKSELPASLTGVNSGSLAIRAEIFHAVMQKWREIDEGTRYGLEDGFWDQASWNALLMRCTSKGDLSVPTDPSHAKWQAEPFQDRGICFAM